MSSTLTVSSFVNHAFAVMLILLLLFLGDLDFLKKRLHISPCFTWVTAYLFLYMVLGLIWGCLLVHLFALFQMVVQISPASFEAEKHDFYFSKLFH
jgi:hypothetical protein